MKRGLLTLFLATALASGALWLHGQQGNNATWDQMLVRSWQNVHTKVLDMAKDFPEDKFDYRPHPDSRSFVEEVWHFGAGAIFSAARARGEQVDAQALFSNEGKPRSREELVAWLEKAVNDSVAALKEKPDPLAVAFLEHQGEHYGKLVTIYRVNGIVPPVTRARQQRSGDE